MKVLYFYLIGVLFFESISYYHNHFPEILYKKEIPISVSKLNRLPNDTSWTESIKFQSQVRNVVFYNGSKSVFTFKSTIVLNVFEWLYTLFEFIIIYFLYALESKNKCIKKLFKLFSFVFIAYTLYEAIFSPWNNDFVILEYLVIISISIIYYYQLLIDLDIPKLSEYYFIYFNAAFLIYFSGSFFIFLFQNQIIDLDIKLMLTLHIFHSLLNIFYLSTLTIGIWKINKK